ncbi:M28 family peptidase [Roseivirga pacifica]
MKYIFGMGAALLLFLSFSANAFQFKPFAQPYYDMVDATFNQNEAFETVAFVEKYFRVVGNEGFNKSIYYAADKLKAAGFVLEEEAKPSDRLTYRIEKRALDKPTWEPVSGSLKLGSGEELLNLETNRNMIAINSFSTKGEQSFEFVNVYEGKEIDNYDVEGKVVVGNASARYLFSECVQKRGAVGVISYRMPDYNQPVKHQNSISFSGIPLDEEKESFAILLSYDAYNKLLMAEFEEKFELKIDLATKIYKSEELTLVAELKGSKAPEERFVFSAHVQEPGANDNASGVGALTEIAASSARLLQSGQIDPERTITYLFGDEIVSTNRYVQEDPERAKGIKWGMSLDMVGEDTEKTGGTFLIEKMPDPGAIWVRGVEKHSEWGGRPLTKEQLKPHYFNDLVISQFKAIGSARNWEVNFNPFEGGSDHVPFLRGNIPGLLLWHFTDVFYHTDRDRIDKVSAQTLDNVGTGALMIALMLTENKEQLADFVLLEASTAAAIRMTNELQLSKSAISEGEDKEVQRDIVATWADYYLNVFETTLDIDPKNKTAFQKNLQETKDAMITLKNMSLGQLN